MNKVRGYFQRHPFVHWLMSVTITLIALTIFGVLVHEKDWLFLIGLSVSVPTMTALLESVKRAK